MSKLIAIRLDPATLSAVDRERKRHGLSRAEAVRQGLALWMAKRRLDEAVRRHRDGYARRPVRPDEFAPVLGAQRWPE